MFSVPGQITLFLAGDVMTGRGIDQILAHLGQPELRESYIKNATQYVELAERAHGSVAKPAPPSYIWGDALSVLADVMPQLSIVNLETSEFWPGKGVHYRMHPSNVDCLKTAGRIGRIKGVLGAGASRAGCGRREGAIRDAAGQTFPVTWAGALSRPARRPRGAVRRIRIRSGVFEFSRERTHRSAIPLPFGSGASRLAARSTWFRRTTRSVPRTVMRTWICSGQSGAVATITSISSWPKTILTELPEPIGPFRKASTHQDGISPVQSRSLEIATFLLNVGPYLSEARMPPIGSFVELGAR